MESNLIGLFIQSVPVVNPMSQSESRRQLDRFPWGPNTIQPNHMCQHIDRPARTIQAAFCGSSQGRHVLDVQTARIKPLSWSEMARLQSFDPQLFDIPSIDEKERIRLIGNAIPPPLVEAVCRNVVNSGICDFSNGRSFVEICAGTGAMGHALEGLGFTPLALIDNEPNSCTFLETHYGRKVKVNTQTINLVRDDDVNDIDFSVYGHVGILCGGPPCQPYSTMGHKKGKSDSRDLLSNMDDLLRALQPNVFIFENVTGVVHGQKAKATFQGMLNKLQSPGKGLNYDVGYQELNAVHYGVPQKRRRIFIIGIQRNGKPKRASLEELFAAIKRDGIYGKSPHHPAKTVREFLDEDGDGIPWKFYPHRSPFPDYV
jgi:site-specific DNA-cytosine methylase